tara:strand:- start:3246 stop:3665 length:420 start_codon:yes stop_codon:yes gene_type:complete
LIYFKDYQNIVLIFLYTQDAKKLAKNLQSLRSMPQKINPYLYKTRQALFSSIKLMIFKKANLITLKSSNMKKIVIAALMTIAASVAQAEHHSIQMGVETGLQTISKIKNATVGLNFGYEWLLNTLVYHTYCSCRYKCSP